MKIGLDARWIFPELSGVGVYTQELIRHLARLDRQNEYFLFFHHRGLLERVAEDTRFNTTPNFSARLLEYGPFSWRSQVQLPPLLSDMHLDVFHAPNYMIPLRAFPRHRPGRIRCVVTLHDLIPLLFPHHAPRALKTRLFPIYRRLMEEVGARADIITTVSQCSRRDIIWKLRIPENRQEQVVVIPNGAPDHYGPAARRADGGQTILYVGRCDPYKNLPMLIEAFARILRGPAPGARLMIIGAPDPRYPEPARMATAQGVDHAIDWRGYASGEELLDAYQQASLLVLPSRYEGFGLPVVEAMACGTPVVCSQAAALSEVAGDAALQVAPDDLEGLVQAMTRVLTDRTLADQLRQKGLQRARQFTWARAAEQTLAAYQQAMLLPMSA
jgi:glycosyltransferase involved in cell wall biosynthesis